MCTFVDAWYRDDGALTPAEIAELYADFILSALNVHDSNRSFAGS